MKIVIGSDHGGVQLKEIMVRFLIGQEHEVVDVGAHDTGPSDYPDFSRSVAEAVLGKKAERGILICGSGVGASVAVNKFPGIRASVCHDTFSAHQGVEDDDMNVLCLGERIIGPELAKEVVLRFLSARFSKAERHVRRLRKVEEIEKEHMK